MEILTGQEKRGGIGGSGTGLFPGNSTGPYSFPGRIGGRHRHRTGTGRRGAPDSRRFSWRHSYDGGRMESRKSFSTCFSERYFLDKRHLSVDPWSGNFM